MYTIGARSDQIGELIQLIPLGRMVEVRDCRYFELSPALYALILLKYSVSDSLFTGRSTKNGIWFASEMYFDVLSDHQKAVEKLKCTQ